MRYLYAVLTSDKVCYCVTDTFTERTEPNYIPITKEQADEVLGCKLVNKRWVKQEIPEEKVMEIIAKKEKQILEIKESIAELSNKAVK